MKTLRAEITRYVLSCQPPFPFRSQRCDLREGALLRLYDEKGREGWGDIAPPPDQPLSALFEEWRAHHSDWIEVLDEPETLAFSRSTLSRILPDGPFSALAWGWLCAVFSYAAACQNKTLAAWLSSDAVDAVASQALIVESSETPVLSQIQEKLKEGFRTMKIKLKPETTQRDWIPEMAPVLKETAIRFRLDSARPWPYSRVEEFWRHLPEEFRARVDFWEDPWMENDRYFSGHEKVPVPFALDALTEDGDGKEWRSDAMFRAIVMKPSLQALTLPWDEWVNADRVSGPAFVVSSAGESPVGLGLLAQWAAAFSPHETAGLDTQSFFPEAARWRFHSRWTGLVRLSPTEWNQRCRHWSQQWTQPIPL